MALHDGFDLLAPTLDAMRFYDGWLGCWCRSGWRNRPGRRGNRSLCVSVELGVDVGVGVRVGAGLGVDAPVPFLLHQRSVPGGIR